MSRRVKLPVLQPGDERTPSEGSSSGGGEPPLPDLHHASLDWDGVDCVLADLDDFVEIRELLGRGASGSPEHYGDLVHARDLFVAGTLHGLQITYYFADQLWVDTLLREPEGARLMRMPVAD